MLDPLQLRQAGSVGYNYTPLLEHKLEARVQEKQKEESNALSSPSTYMMFNFQAGWQC